MREQELLSARIEFYRKSQRLTYYKLANRSAIPLTTLMHIVNGSTKILEYLPLSKSAVD